MTQGELGQAVGVSLRTVGNWERGESVPLNRVGALEDVLGVSLRPAASAPRSRAEQAILDSDEYTPEQKEALLAMIRAFRSTGGATRNHA